VTIRLRDRQTHLLVDVIVVCPIRWSKSRLLAYCRKCHPLDTVKILDWPTVGSPGNPWKIRVWIVHPSEMFDEPMAVP
jgi:hypothetical protein